MDFQKEGKTYKLNFANGEEGLTCEKEGSQLTCEDFDLVLTKARKKFEYDELLMRIHNENN